MAKRAVALSNENVSEIHEPILSENVETTLEEYKTLSEKCDEVIIKIKDRKARKKKS